MSERQVTLSSEQYREAPAWMFDYVRQLAAITRHTRPWSVVIAPAEFFAALQDGVMGGCLQMENGTDVLIMPDWAEETEYWRDILAHEFAHCLHSSIDRVVQAGFVQGAVDRAAYEAAVEPLAALVGGLAQFAAQHAQVADS